MGLDRDFLTMLTARPTLARYTGEDAFGNELYADAEVIAAFVEDVTSTFGTQDTHGEQDPQVVLNGSLMTDAIGITIKDKIILQAFDPVFYVSQEDTTRDEFGMPLFQTVTITTQKRG